MGCGLGPALFYGPLSGTFDTSEADAAFVGEADADGAGQGVEIGDLDGDGLGEVIIDAPGESTKSAAAGAVYVQYQG